MTQHDISSATATKVTGMDVALTAGTYVFDYSVIGRSTSATVGLFFGINYTGTTTSFRVTEEYPSNGLTASSDTCDNVIGTAAAEQLTSVGAAITLSTTSPNLNVMSTVTTTGEDCLVHLRGVIVVSDAGNIELYHASDTTTQTSVMAGSSLIIQKITAGADLAEIYGTKDAAIEPGDVVSHDSSMKAGVKKSVKAYDPNTFGIISTAPGLTTGTLDDPGAIPVQVALSGRVPVKVNTENGPIKFGDLLTASSTPGVAMRATKAGQVIGQAMSEYSGDGIGKVMAFVKTDYGTGSKIADLLPEGLVTEGSDAPVIDNNKIILSQFIAEKGILETSVNLSEISTDRLMAGLEIITPTLVADTVEVNTITSSTGESITIGSPVEFSVPPLFNKDTAGFALMKQGSNKVEITFENPYVAQPVVSANITFEDGDNLTDAQADEFFNQNIQILTTNKTQNGFTIRLNKNAPRDIRLSWTAFAVKDAKVFESVMDGLVIENTYEAPSSGAAGGQEASPESPLEPSEPSNEIIPAETEQEEIPPGPTVENSPGPTESETALPPEGAPPAQAPVE